MPEAVYAYGDARDKKLKGVYTLGTQIQSILARLKRRMDSKIEHQRRWFLTQDSSLLSMLYGYQAFVLGVLLRIMDLLVAVDFCFYPMLSLNQ